MITKKYHVDRNLGGGLQVHLVSPPGQDQWFVSSFDVDKFEGPVGMPYRLDTLTAHPESGNPWGPFETEDAACKFVMRLAHCSPN